MPPFPNEKVKDYQQSRSYVKGFDVFSVNDRYSGVLFVLFSSPLSASIGFQSNNFCDEMITVVAA